MTSKVAALVSGGLDSGALIAALTERFDQVYPIFIRQGLRWEKAELAALRHFLRALPRPVRPLTVLEFPMRDLYAGHWSVQGRRVPGARTADKAVELPGRNLTLSLKAAIWCAARRIPVLAIGSLAHNPFPDASLSFFRLWSRALSRGLGRSIRLIAPFRQQSKTWVIRRYQQWPLHHTLSCLAPRGGRHCGRCNKCAERRRAFREAGVKE